MATAKEQRAKRIAALLAQSELKLTVAHIVYLDQQLAMAMKNCDKLIASDDSRSDVLRTITSGFDQQFRRFVTDSGFPPPTWKFPEPAMARTESTGHFSELVKYRFDYADELICKWSRPHLKWMLENTPRTHGVAVKSIDTLRVFLQRCHAQIPMTRNAIVLEDNRTKAGKLTTDSPDKQNKELNIEKNANQFRGRQRNHNEKKTRIRNSLPGYLQLLLDPSFCELCFKPTTFKVRLDEEKKLRPEYYAREIASLVSEGNYPQIVEGYSTQYCVDHIGASSDRRPHEEKRLHFYSAMRLIREVQMIKNNSLPPQRWRCEDERRYGFWLACVPYSRSPFLKNLPDIVKNYVDFPFEYHLTKLTVEVTLQQELLKEELVNLLQQLETNSTRSKKWSTKCLGDLPRTCHHKYT
ncbi:hypothetical protein AAKU67_003921 [Oxalobacteraceae bacterium GrIS 2.11]